MAAPLRVLELLVSTSLGGGPAHVRDVVAGLAGPEFELTVAGPAGGAAVPELVAAGTTFVPLRTDRLSAATLLGTIRLARHRAAQIIHSHGKGAGLYGRLAGRLLGIPTVHTFHGIHDEGYGRGARAAYLVLERRLAAWSSAIVHVSASQARLAEPLGLAPPDRTRVIVNGIVVERLRALARDQPLSRQSLGVGADALVLGTVARFDAVKALDVLLDAFARLAARVPAARLVLVGAGPEDARLRQRARALELEDRVRFAGLIPMASRGMPALDLYVSASRREGLPLAVLEAMAAERAVLATAIPGHLDAIVEGVTGRLVPPDDPGALAAAAEALLRDPDARRTMGAAGRARVEREFSAGRMVSETAALYRSVAASLSRRDPRMAGI